MEVKERRVRLLRDRDCLVRPWSKGIGNLAGSVNKAATREGSDEDGVATNLAKLGDEGG